MIKPELKRVGTEALKILLVEDNIGDVRLAQEAFQECDIRNDVIIAHDGEQALHVLRHPELDSGGTSPDLILLDLNLPKKDGRSVLKEIKNDSALKHIPVVVLTTSTADDDVIQAYELHANCYIVKPFELAEFMQVVQQIESFWLETVRLPRRAL